MAQLINRAFTEHMACASLPLFRDFDTYSASLPVREVKYQAPLRLYKVPYFMRQQDLDHTVSRLPIDGDGSKERVLYVAAPSGSGKSASVLPIFLRSIEQGQPFTHYIYMPFANNGGRYHWGVEMDLKYAAVLDKVRAVAGKGAPAALRRMGSAYMLECFRKQLQNEVWREGLGLLEAPMDVAQELRREVQKVLRSRPGGKLLLHIDEHRDMSFDAEFRRGALSALGEMCDLITVVTTYTDLPTLPARGSSGTCRSPLPKPLFDVARLLKVVDRSGPGGDTEQWSPAGYPVLRVPTVTDGRERRLMASFRVVLGLAVTRMGLTKLHTGSDDVRSFFASMQKVLDTPVHPVDTSADRLVEALLACPLEWPEGDALPQVVDLLLGVPEARANEERLPCVVALDTYLTAPLEVLMTAFDEDDPLNGLFECCQNLLKQSLRNVADFCEGKVLERAFLWALACRAGRKQSLTFQDEGARFLFQCRTVAPGRIFPRGSAQLEIELVRALMQETLYYADEGRKVGTHPLSDLWFKTADHQLVLIDISGSANWKSCVEKIDVMCGAVRKESERVDFEKLKVSGLRGVVLLPNLDRAPIKVAEVEVVVGKAARRLLGGLAQLLTWLGDDLLD